jgi:hypothetical protein
VEGVKVKATVSRAGIDDLHRFIGLPFLTPDKQRLGEIVAVDAKQGPYCDVTISIDLGKIANPYIREIFFPNNY